MNKRNKGFTLIELLAVIVILGLLMAIAIPSVTKYITQSRKKTVISSIENYISALINQVNDMHYTFTRTNTIYAVPIECIALERGGTNPFGKWHQSNDAYWAYVLIQYDDRTSSYIYGFTFKDSAGYGLYPTTSEKLNESGSQILTDLSLSRPSSGSIVNITEMTNWKGFVIDDNTMLRVLESETENVTGDGQSTCTLCQKGDNYDSIEQDRQKKLSTLIKKNNTLINAEPTLTTSSNNTSDASGLYVSSNTSGGNTYYFRGNVVNNNVRFAGLDWKIIRINEDGTVRLILNKVIYSSGYKFNSSYNSFEKMYYSNGSSAKKTLDEWYKQYIIDKGYDSYVVTGVFCEQAKTTVSHSWINGNAGTAEYKSYVPNFNCAPDGNGKGVVTSKVGLITYDEVVYAGGYYRKSNSNYYLIYGGSSFMWTMSPAGFDSEYANVWRFYPTGELDDSYVTTGNHLRPVINLSANILFKGTGTSSDPYVVITN